MKVWVNCHTMIALTIMMLAAEAYGFDTAPMEGFEAQAIKHEFSIPNEAEVVALLAIGSTQEPDKPYPGRFPLDQIVFSEQFGTPWVGAEAMATAEESTIPTGFAPESEIPGANIINHPGTPSEAARGSEPIQ